MKLTGSVLFPLGLAWVALACSTPAKVSPPAPPAPPASPAKQHTTPVSPAPPAKQATPVSPVPPATQASPGQKPVFSVEKTALDLGMVKEGDEAVATFAVRNTGNATLRILRATPG